MKHNLKPMILLICSLALQIYLKISFKKGKCCFHFRKHRANHFGKYWRYCQQISANWQSDKLLQGGERSSQRCSPWLCYLHKWSKKCKYWLKQSLCWVIIFKYACIISQQVATKLQFIIYCYNYYSMFHQWNK